PHVIQFTEENDESAIKELRNHVVNTIKQAENYAGSKIQKQIEALRGKKEKPADEDSDTPEGAEETPAPVEKPKPKPAARKTAAKPAEPATGDDPNADIPW